MWTDEKIKTLRNLWGRGASMGQLAKTLDMSRSAIAGKIHRLGLKRGTSSNPIGRRGGRDLDKIARRDAMRHSGWTAVEIARAEGIAPESMSVYAARYGLTKQLNIRNLGSRLSKANRAKKIEALGL